MVHDSPHLDEGTMKAILDKLYQVIELWIAQAIKTNNVRKCASLDFLLRLLESIYLSYSADSTAKKSVSHKVIVLSQALIYCS